LSAVDRWNSVVIPERVKARAAEKVDIDSNGCMISRYSLGSHGYPQIGWRGDGERHLVLVHRATWEAENGPVPLGMTLDHVCKVKACVNPAPAHHRLLANLDNARRTAGRDWPLGECIRGHSDDHLVERRRGPVNGGGVKMRCIICEREDQRAYRARLAA
jgi:hypothetical protein